MSKRARPRQRKTAIVPKVVLSLALAGVIPTLGVSCGQSPPQFSVAAIFDMAGDQPQFSVAAIFDMAGDQPQFTVAAIFDMASSGDAGDS